MPTHYDILGLDRNASFEDVRHRYKELASYYHPDKNPSEHEKFKQINKAYEVLKDYHKRKEYDDNLDNNHNHNYNDLKPYHQMTSFFRDPFFSFPSFTIPQFNFDEIDENNFNGSVYSYSSSYSNNNGVETHKVTKQTLKDGKKTIKENYVKKNNGQIIDQWEKNDDNYVSNNKRIQY